MKVNEKQDVISAWNEIEEVLQNFDLSKSDFNSCKDASIERLKRALELLGDHFTDEEAQTLV